ncbi:hypothetical protein [Nonomuraea dietziae]|uniref:hypothetical protein n=1 Tax=Nonomuraea dietziae TaxID=65515 RepID=UPI0033E2BC3F
MALAIAPLILLFAVAMAPTWIHDYYLARIMDRVLSYPLPSGAEFGFSEPQGKISGESNMCVYYIRFDVHTDGSAKDVLKYYQTAKTADIAGDYAWLNVSAWVPFNDPEDETGFYTTQAVIVDLMVMSSTRSAWDFRCR